MDCRYCNYSLDSGDIYYTLSQMEFYKYHTKEELLKVANCYGWTPENPKHFSKETIIQFEDKPQINICPKCNGKWPTSPDKPKEYYIT
jgi:hypothetical protein